MFPCFFFSSRRRHTRFDCDWSSDVCSSDLPNPEWESALYGAAGVAHHAELTRLLLERGADPNDAETPSHTPETYHHAAMHALVDSGKLSDDSLATMLLRKADWHDHEGIKFLLEHRADPNRMTRWQHTALQHALRRDNAIENIELLLDHGADATLENRADGKSAVTIAARRGRGDGPARSGGPGAAPNRPGGARRGPPPPPTTPPGAQPAPRREPPP